MSAPRHRIPLKFRALLRDRGLSVARVAVAAGLPARRAQYALSNAPGARLADRHAIAPWLTMAEHIALGWTWNGDLLPVEQSGPSATLSATTSNP